jgi:hypothetical protein
MGYADEPTVGQKVEVKVAGNMPNASVKTTTGWTEVNWRKLERQLFQLQNRIYRASQRGDSGLYGSSKRP